MTGCPHVEVGHAYTHCQCRKCGAVLTDTVWGRASRQWFPSLAHAEAYKWGASDTPGEPWQPLAVRLAETGHTQCPECKSTYEAGTMKAAAVEVGGHCLRCHAAPEAPGWSIAQWKKILGAWSYTDGLEARA